MKLSLCLDYKNTNMCTKTNKKTKLKKIELLVYQKTKEKKELNHHTTFFLLNIAPYNLLSI